MHRLPIPEEAVGVFLTVLRIRIRFMKRIRVAKDYGYFHKNQPKPQEYHTLFSKVFKLFNGHKVLPHK